MIVGERLYTMGSRAVMHCHHRKTGRLLWRRDLAEEFGATYAGRLDNDIGFPASPIAYGDSVIVVLGRSRVKEVPPEGEWDPIPTPVWEGEKGLLILLDENGRLTLGKPSSEGLEVLSRDDVMDKYSLTAPALLGTKLFIRDREKIVALDLG